MVWICDGAPTGRLGAPQTQEQSSGERCRLQAHRLRVSGLSILLCPVVAKADFVHEESGDSKNSVLGVGGSGWMGPLLAFNIRGCVSWKSWK